MGNRIRSFRAKRKRIAKERIYILFGQAEKQALAGKLRLANRYVELARKLGMKYLVRIPHHLKHQFCPQCYTYLLPGANCMVRLTRQHLAIHCKSCGAIRRIPYTRDYA